MGRAAASSSLSTSCPPTHIFSSHPHSVTVSAAGIVLRRFTAEDPVIAACHASFIGDGREAASLAILHAAGRTLSVVGPGGALARVPFPTPAARMWALGPDRGLLLAGIGGGGLSLAHPLDAPEPVAGWGAGAGVVWASARDGLALTAAAAAAAGGDTLPHARRAHPRRGRPAASRRRRCPSEGLHSANPRGVGSRTKRRTGRERSGVARRYTTAFRRAHGRCS